MTKTHHRVFICIDSIPACDGRTDGHITHSKDALGIPRDTVPRVKNTVVRTSVISNKLFSLLMLFLFSLYSRYIQQQKVRENSLNIRTENSLE